MIATLRGKVLGNTESAIIVEVGGIGYSVTTVPSVRLGEEVGRELFLHTAMVVREDSWTLFGYQSASERDLFQLLQTVSGIGPKVSHATQSLNSETVPTGTAVVSPNIVRSAASMPCEFRLDVVPEGREFISFVLVACFRISYNAKIIIC